MKRIATWINLAVMVFFALGEVPMSHSEPMPPLPTQALSLSKVVLYSSGVGYVEHDGMVRGQGHVNLLFTVDQINDVLKSLVVQDAGGGRISTVSYGSCDPIMKTEGLRSIPLAQVQWIQLLNPQLNGELQQTLSVLATAHDANKRTVSILFEGEGNRNVRVAYITEAPIWKTSYRLMLDDAHQPFLHG